MRGPISSPATSMEIEQILAIGPSLTPIWATRPYSSPFWAILLFLLPSLLSIIKCERVPYDYTWLPTLPICRTNKYKIWNDANILALYQSRWIMIVVILFDRYLIYMEYCLRYSKNKNNWMDFNWTHSWFQFWVTHF